MIDNYQAIEILNRSRIERYTALRLEVEEMIDDLFPPEEQDHGFCLDRAMGYYYHDLQDLMHRELVKYAADREYGSRSRMHFFGTILECPLDVAEGDAR